MAFLNKFGQIIYQLKYISLNSNIIKREIEMVVEQMTYRYLLGN
jgi:hypothetical protein